MDHDVDMIGFEGMEEPRGMAHEDGGEGGSTASERAQHDAHLPERIEVKPRVNLIEEREDRAQHKEL
jgi:hypothetical protein